MKKTLTALLLTLALAPASGQETSTEAVVAGRLASESGDAGRMNDHEGTRNGAVLEAHHTGPGLTIDFGFQPTTEGWLSFAWKPDAPFRLEVTIDRTRRYSDTSVRPELTPLGTPVSQFTPGTNTLEPVFGDIEPVTTRTRWKARAAYLFPAGTVDLTFAGAELHGDKAAEPQGIAFGDFGAPAFFTPGLRGVDSSSLEGALGARFAFGGFTLKGRVAFGNRNEETSLTLPAWGATRLLDVSRYTDFHDATYHAESLSAGYQSQLIQAALGGAASEVSSTPGYTGGLNGAPPTDVLTGASSEVKRHDGAGSFAIEPLPGLTVKASGSLGREETRASGLEAVGTRSYALDQSQDVDRWKSAGEVSWLFSGLRVSALAGREKATTDSSFVRGASVDQSEAERTTDHLRGELRYKAGGFKVMVSGGRRWDEVAMTYKELLSGYQLGSREGTRDDVTLAFSGKLGKVPFQLVGSATNGTADLQPPLYEPIYDPTWELSVATAKTKARSFLAHVATPGGSAFELWAELGYRQQTWEFCDTVTFPGFLNTDEEVEGFTGALGLTWVPAEGWKVDLSGWADAPSQTVDHRAYRIEAGLEKSLTKTLDALFRVHFRDFSEALYSLDDYTLAAFTLGVKGRF